MASNQTQLDIFDGQNVTQSRGFTAATDGRKSLAHDFVPGTSVRPSNDQRLLSVPLQDTFRSSIDTLSGVSTYSADYEGGRSTARSLLPALERVAWRSPAPIRALTGRWTSFWQKYKGITLVLISQLFGGFMNAATRMLETQNADGPPMSPFQVFTDKTIPLIRQSDQSADPVRTHDYYHCLFTCLYAFHWRRTCSIREERRSKASYSTWAHRICWRYVLLPRYLNVTY